MRAQPELTPGVTTCSAWLRDLAHFSEGSPDGGEPPLAVGERLLDRFEIRRLVGRGGMGFVYEAFDEELRTLCALKTLNALRPERVLLLKNEFRALAGVHHPNLVRPGQLLQAGQRWFFTMELVVGMDPLRWVGGDGERLCHVLRELASVLWAMHEKRLIHRDIKPSNVIVAESGRVVLLDLGLARDTEQPMWFDVTSGGTWSYMPPEPPPLGPPADWYALGVLLYELATGHRPFDGTGDRLLAQKRDPRCIPSLRAKRADLSPQLDHLLHDLLAVEPEARPDGREVLRRLHAGSGVRRRPADNPRLQFIGRGSELERLRMALGRVEAGQPAAVFVHGPSGIGKTALVEAFLAEIARTGTIVLAGRCYERESVAFKTLDGVIDAIAALLSRYSASECRELIPAAAAPLGSVFPALQALEVFAECGQDSRPVRREDVFPALRALLRALSLHSRVVLFVDDLHWADADGLALLGHALAPPDGPAILLMACSRNADRPEALASLAGPISLCVEPLSAADAKALAVVHCPGVSDVADIARLVREAGGHPLFVQELARLFASSPGAGSLGLDDVIRFRAQALEEPSRRLLEVIAVASAPVPKRVLALASGLPPEELERELRILEGEYFTRASADASSIEAFHDRVRESVVQHLPPETLAVRHRSLAEAYEQTSPLAPARLAVHWAGAGEGSRAFRYARTAGDQAVEGLAFAQAAELYALALDVAAESDEHHGLRVKRAHALVHAWRPLEAARAFMSAASSAGREERRGLRMRAVEQLLIGGDIDSGLVELAGALGERGISTPRTLPGRLLNALVARARLRFHRGPWSFLASAQGTPEDIDALLGAGQALAMLDVLVALGYHAQASMMALRSGDPVHLVRALSLESTIQAGSASFSEAARLIEQVDELLLRTPSPMARLWRGGARLVLAVQLGEWSEGLDLGERAATDPAPRTAWMHAARELYVAHCEYNLGRFLELAERWDHARREASRRNDRFFEIALGISFGPIVHLMRDEVDQARSLVDDMGKRVWHGGVGYFHALHSVSALFVELYDRRDTHRLGKLPPFASALARRSHYGRVYLRYLDANLALAALRESGRSSLSLKRRVGAAIRSLRRDPVPWAGGYAELLSAELAHLEGQHDACLQRLAGARATFVRFGSEHMVDVVDRARLLCEAPDRAGEAEARLKGRGVVRPDRFAAMLAPAFG